jgi:type 1 glutamine amidotransferase
LHFRDEERTKKRGIVLAHQATTEIAEQRLFYAFESAWLCHQGETWETCEPKTMIAAAMLTAAREKAGLS